MKAMTLLELVEPEFEVNIASTSEQIRASQRLRYEVFIEEMGGNGKLVDHVNKLEKDEFDPFFEHWDLILDLLLFHKSCRKYEKLMMSCGSEKKKARG